MFNHEAKVSVNYEPWQGAAAVVHMAFCEDYSSFIPRNKSPLLIGPTKSMPLGKLNRLLAWYYTCPMMALKDQKQSWPCLSVLFVASFRM